jgi:hypothetical protein
VLSLTMWAAIAFPSAWGSLLDTYHSW